MADTRFSPDCSPQAKVPKLCITPLGAPVVPLVYMMVPSSSAPRTGWPASGGVLATMSSQPGQRFFASSGASGWLMQARPAGMPDFMPSQPSSLPTNSSRDSLCSRIWRMVPAASVGYSGTETKPPSQMAKSLISQCAVFLDSSATLSPRFRPRLCRCAAMRRLWSITSRQV